MRKKECKEIVEDIVSVLKGETPLNDSSFEDYISEEEIRIILQDYANDYMADAEFSHLSRRRRP